jgi:hypothetical protein
MNLPKEVQSEQMANQESTAAKFSFFVSHATSLIYRRSNVE